MALGSWIFYVPMFSSTPAGQNLGGNDDWNKNLNIFNFDWDKLFMNDNNKIDGTRFIMQQTT
jgi:hypothetical protein